MLIEARWRNRFWDVVLCEAGYQLDARGVHSLVAITGKEDAVTFQDKVRTIIREHLAAYPGTTKDRVYDEVISRMVRSGFMEAHNFDELLRQVAEPAGVAGNGSERWYLKESELDETDTAEATKEDAAAQRIRTFIDNQLKSHLGEEGVHYSDIFEHYVYVLKDKPRRPLAEWLLDYFYKTDRGTYRLPASEEEERLKAGNRKKASSRGLRFRRGNDRAVQPWRNGSGTVHAPAFTSRERCYMRKVGWTWTACQRS